MEKENKNQEAMSAMTISEISLSREQAISIVKFNEYSLSDEGILLGLARLRSVYPTLSKGFLKQLVYAIEKKKFTDDKFQRAIDNVFFTCRFIPSIADIVSFELDVSSPSKTLTPEEQKKQEKERIEEDERYAKETEDMLDNWEKRQKEEEDRLNYVPKGF